MKGRRIGGLPTRIGAMPPRVGAAPKSTDPFYGSAAWKKARKPPEGTRCGMCGGAGSLICDHKVERRDGGADLDKANLQWLCAPCHQVKTRREQRRRVGLER